MALGALRLGHGFGLRFGGGGGGWSRQEGRCGSRQRDWLGRGGGRDKGWTSRRRRGPEEDCGGSAAGGNVREAKRGRPGDRGGKWGWWRTWCSEVADSGREVRSCVDERRVGC